MYKSGESIERSDFGSRLFHTKRCSLNCNSFSYKWTNGNLNQTDWLWIRFLVFSEVMTNFSETLYDSNLEVEFDEMSWYWNEWANIQIIGIVQLFGVCNFRLCLKMSVFECDADVMSFRLLNVACGFHVLIVHNFYLLKSMVITEVVRSIID